MKQKLFYLNTLLIILNFPLFAQTYNQYTEYVGYVPIENYIDEAEPNAKWLHKTTIKIHSNSIISVQKTPITINNIDTFYSSNDGGFYIHTGKIKYFNKNKIEIIITKTDCDYCALKIKSDESAKNKGSKIIKWKGYILDNELIINGITYKKLQVLPIN